MTERTLGVLLCIAIGLTLGGIMHTMLYQRDRAARLDEQLMQRLDEETVFWAEEEARMRALADAMEDDTPRVRLIGGM
jgi:hypothetical protein